MRSRGWLYLGWLLRTLGLVLFAALAKPLVGGLASVFFAAGLGIMMPPLQSMSTNTVADELRGGVLGVYQSTISLSTIVSTAVAGFIFAFDPAMPYWIGALLSLVVLLPSIALIKQTGAHLHKVSPAGSPAD